MWFSSFILKNLFRRKVRSLLTATGIAVAIGAMVALLGITDGFKKSTIAGFEKHGVDLVVTSGNVDQLSSNLDMRLADRIAAIDGVKEVGTGLLTLLDCRREKGNAVVSLMVQGWEPGTFQFDTMKVLQGRLLEPGDKRVAILGPTAAANLKTDVGDVVRIGEEPFQVIGIAEGVTVFENGFITIPLDQMQRLAGMPGRVTGFSVVLEKPDKNPVSVEEVQKQIQQLQSPDGKPIRLSALPTQEYVNGMMHIRIARAMALVTSIVAVLIGGIGMLNTMIMSVLERIKEIGILRAVGWRKRRVVQMILGESVLLSLLGALLGVCGAVLLTHFLTRFPTVNGFLAGDISVVIMLEGFLIAVAVGFLGGVYPAWRAARLLPTEAVRHE